MGPTAHVKVATAHALTLELKSGTLGLKRPNKQNFAIGDPAVTQTAPRHLGTVGHSPRAR